MGNSTIANTGNNYTPEMPLPKIYVAGHRGMVGAAIVRRLQAAGMTNLVLRTRSELDLCEGAAVARFFAVEKPDVVFLAAAKVGGILANKQFKGDFIRENLLIQTHVIHESMCVGVKKLVFLGSSCIYPKFAPQPLLEESLLTGKLEETNDAYAMAKIAGITMCRAYAEQYGSPFFSVMPTNLYGPGDNYNLETSHVLPAMIRKFHEAKLNNVSQMTLWGSGSPMREFLHVDDLADAVVHLAFLDRVPDLINIGTGKDIVIRDLADLVAKIVGYTGDIVWDSSKPDGTPRKCLDITLLNTLGWKSQIGLVAGITATYQDFLKTQLA
jgi:GDP-L-fucose synthase